MALLATAGLYSCGDKTEIDAPTQLRAGSISSTGATLMWDGKAESYMVDVNGAIVMTENTSYAVTGLAPSTSYTWKVRSVTSEGSSDWVSSSFTTAPATPEADFTVSVNFGDGREEWVAAFAHAYYYDDNTIEIILSKINSEDDFVPCVWALAYDSGTTTYPDSSGCYFEYFSEEYWNGRDYVDDNGIPYGDWEAESGTITITSYANSLVSGSMEGIMLDTYETYENQTLTVTFTDVPVTAAPEESTAKKAVPRMAATKLMKRQAGQ